MVRKEIVNIPVVGRVAAGSPILAVENIESYFPVPAELIPAGKETFILTVKGESMINAGIHDKDLLIVQEARNCSQWRNCSGTD